jgi:hypothetical protein
LEAVTLGQQGNVFRSQVLHDGVKAFPKLVAAHAGVGQHFGFDELVQVGSNLQAVCFRALGAVLAHGEVSPDK